MDVRIDRGVPVPPPAPVAKHRYRWREMEVGDSFLFPADAREASARALAHQTAQRLGIKLTCRATPEGLRCWRIA